MTSEFLISRVEDYFAAVDRKDLAATLSFFTPNAVFTIATFDVIYCGRDSEISDMFERLFARYERIWHGDFKHVVQQPDRIASRFRVENRTPEGLEFRKNNSNFFHATGESFHEVFVFMSGDNALH